MSLLALYLSAWPLIWRVVIAPAADPAKQGLMVEARALSAEGAGQALRRWRAGAQDLALGETHTRASARGIWRVPAGGAYGLRLQADDYASLRLDRRLIINQPAQASDLSSAEVEISLPPGPRLLELSLTNLEGQGWLRLYLRSPGGQEWQPLPLEQLRPIDLGNLDLWLGLAAWLEGLSLWGLLGLLVALPLVFRPAWPWAGRARRGIMAVWLGLPLILALARHWPAMAQIPWLTTYSPDLRLWLLGLLGYALLIVVCVGQAVDGWSRRLYWCLPLLLLACARIYAWPYSMYCGLHPDWTSFAGFYHKFGDLFLSHQLGDDFSLGGLLAYLADVARNLYVGYPSGCFSFPALLMGAGAMITEAALWGTGAGQGFPLAGHLLGPAFNLAYALLLMLFYRQHWRQPGQDDWSWLLLLLLCFVPTHIYLGANITYNLLADALHLALLLVGLGLMQAWDKLLASSTGQAEPGGLQITWRPLLGRGLVFALLLGLCLATKLVFIPALLTLLAYLAALVLRHRRARPGLVWMALPGFWLAALALGGLVYGLIIIRNVLNVPGFWRQMLSMTGDNTGLSLAKLGLPQCLGILWQDLLVPNLGLSGALAGALGLGLLGWRAFTSRQLARAMVWLWVVLCLGLNLLSWSMLLMFNAMPRSSMLMGLWLALALYLAQELWQALAARQAPGWRTLAKTALVLVVGGQTMLAGLGLLVMYGAGAPRHQAEGFLSTLAGGERQVAGVMYLGYGDDPNTVLERRVVYHSLRRQVRDLELEDSRRRLIAKARADYWLLTSYEAYFMRGGEQAAAALREELARQGFGLQRRFDSRPFPHSPWLAALYEQCVGPLMAGPRRGGLQEPAYVEVYGRNTAKE